MNNSPLHLWKAFCEEQGVINDSVALFDMDTYGNVRVKEIGRENKRAILARSKEMEGLIRQKCSLLIEDWTSGDHRFDGLLYIMHTIEGEQIIPYYIGKAETIGKGIGNLSANIKGIESDTSKFARWGDNYAYHIGDLSAVVLPDHNQKYIQPKYISWADQLFEEYPSHHPKLKKPIYFWTKAWSSEETGIWKAFGPTKLTFLEYLLIGVASSSYPNTLLNREGKNR